MEATPVRILDYFNGEKQNLIPLFQRGYSWELKHWKALWSDLLTQYAQPETKHFLGAIVSMPARTVPVGVNKHLVIDGQQRLTTIALLLIALRERVDARTAGRIEDYLVNRHHFGTADYLTILPTQVDRDIYQQLVSKDASLPNHPMMDAVNYFRTAIDGRDLDDQQLEPNRIFEALVDGFQVVMINLGDTDDPYLIFESLNYKGEPLTQADLVRNYILMRFRHSVEPGGDQEQIYREFWRPLEDSLGNQLTEFLRHYVVKGGREVKTGGVYAATKDALQRKSGEQELREELLRIAAHGRYYQRFLNPTEDEDADLAACLQAFLELKVGASYPLLLRLYEARETEASGFSSADLAASLIMVESFLVRRMVCQLPTNSHARIFAQLARDCPESDITLWLQRELLNRWISLQECWNAETIQRRGHMLADTAMEIWPQASVPFTSPGLERAPRVSNTRTD